VSRPVLTVRGCGMTTAVGLTAPASCAAIRGRLDGIQETRFRFGGEWLRAAAVPLEEPWRGLPRLAWLVAGPIAECLACVPDQAPEGIAVLLGVAEPDRPGRDANLDTLLLPAVQSVLGMRFHAASRLLPMGRVAGVAALQHAAHLFAGNGPPWVIVAGVDSYLVTGTLDWLFGRDRLLTETTLDGFIPGEAGAAVLCGRDGGGLGVLSFGFGTEPAPLGSGRPLRGDGMTAACRSALTAAGLTMAGIGYRLATLNGEQHFFREIDLATTRLLRGRHDAIDLLHPAGSVGEVGAAALPLALGLAAAAARDGWAPGDPVLIAASNDDGRCAVLLASASA
jgi:3-oxoacyl-[acyl-carrier-protein] synthase-1